MSNIALFNQNQIQSASITELKTELSKSLKITSDYLVYMSLIWSELNRRGEDMSELKSGLFQYIPLIATNQLDASLVVEFAGNKTLLSALSRLPLDQQKEIAISKKIPFIELGESLEMVETELDLTTARPRQIYQVLGGESGFRNSNEQYLYLKAKNKVKRKPRNKSRTTLSNIEFDDENEYLLVGDDHRVKIEKVLNALSELYNVDMFEVMSRYSSKIAKK